MDPGIMRGPSLVPSDRRMGAGPPRRKGPGHAKSAPLTRGGSASRGAPSLRAGGGRPGRGGVLVPASGRAGGRAGPGRGFSARRTKYAMCGRAGCASGLCGAALEHFALPCRAGLLGQGGVAGVWVGCTSRRRRRRGGRAERTGRGGFRGSQGPRGIRRAAVRCPRSASQMPLRGTAC